MPASSLDCHFRHNYNSWNRQNKDCKPASSRGLKLRLGILTQSLDCQFGPTQYPLLGNPGFNSSWIVVLSEPALSL